VTRSKRCGLAPACVALLLLGAAPPDSLRNADPPASPRRAAPAGKILFSDDFGTDSLGLWQPDRAGVWSVHKGMLRGDLPNQRQVRSMISIAGSHWQDIRVDFDVCALRGVDKGVVIRASGNHGIAVDLRGPGYDDVLLHRGRHKLGKAAFVNPNRQWHHVTIEATGARYRVFVNEQLLIEEEDRQLVVPGRVSLPAYTGGVGACTVWYDNVVVTALETERER
jgi:hypothetical protein